MRQAAFCQALLVLLLAGPAAAQQAVKVERIEVSRPGTYDIGVRGAVPDQAISTGNRVEAKAYKNLKVGTQIELRKGTIIGAEVLIVGAPRRGKVPLRVIWSYPEPGLTNPETKVTKATDEYSDTQLVGEKFPVFWGLTQEWQLVPGTWTLEIWHGESKLATQQFQLKKP
jgi:hypothetical protein